MSSIPDFSEIELDAVQGDPADAAELEARAAALRLRHWRTMHEAGIDLLPVGDFSLYDHMLDASVMFGVVPMNSSLNQAPRPAPAPASIVTGSDQTR